MKGLLQSCCGPPAGYRRQFQIFTLITQSPACDRIIVSKLIHLKLHGWPTDGGQVGITWYDSVKVLTRTSLCEDCLIRPSQFTHAKPGAI